MSTDIQHDPASSRFTTHLDGHEAYLEYSQIGETLTITHTIVPSAIGGRGIAGQLVKQAMEHAKAAGLKVDPACSYAETWMQRHSEYADLRS